MVLWSVHVEKVPQALQQLLFPSAISAMVLWSVHVEKVPQALQQLLFPSGDQCYGAVVCPWRESSPSTSATSLSFRWSVLWCSGLSVCSKFPVHFSFLQAISAMVLWSVRVEKVARALQQLLFPSGDQCYGAVVCLRRYKFPVHSSFL